MNTAGRSPLPFLERRLFWRITPAHLLLMGLMLLSTGLHFWNIGAIGNSNAYYTAAVESMTQSWHNFFFAAAEPGGSVTVDKPPLGLWIETLFALLLGVSGFSTSLPNILAGILGIPLLYHLVRKHLGTAVGLLAGMVMAMTPVVFATDRNNTADGMLTFVLLLAAWAFLKATESGKLGHLLLGAFLVGLGFNIKMMQALLPLPAFYGLYFLASRNRWWQKLLQLGLATILLVVISFSWAVAVDLTPADERPYIGSSDDNSVMSLIIGYNGLQRLLGGGWNRLFDQNGTPPAIPQAPVTGGYGTIPGAIADAPSTDAPKAPNNVGSAFSNETGLPGLLRFFLPPLAKEMSWLLPFALAGILLGLFTQRMRLPVRSGAHKAMLLWGGWLLTCLVFFSTAKFFHAYYLVMLAPAMGGAVGLGCAGLKTIKETRPVLSVILLTLMVLGTISVQIALVMSFSTPGWWLALPVLGLLVGVILLAWGMTRTRSFSNSLAQAGTWITLLSITIIPLAWSMLTVFGPKIDAGLPGAYAGNRINIPPANTLGRNNLPANLPPYSPGYPLPGPCPQNLQPPSGIRPGSAQGQQPPNQAARNDQMIDFLEENTEDIEYLLAVPSAQVGAPLVIETGRPVLYMGGFNGGDPVIDANGLAQMVADGELRYVLYQAENHGAGRRISTWLKRNCSVVPGLFPALGNNARSDGLLLYQCSQP